MTLPIQIPTAGEPIVVELSQVENKLFMLGANGTGKSALLHHIYQQHSQQAHKVAAYRQTYLASGTLDMSGSQYRAATNNLRQWDSDYQSRYTETRSGYSRTNRTLAALMQNQRERDRSATALLDEGKNEAAEQYVQGHRDPFDIINGLFESSNLEVRVFIRPNDPDTLVAQHITTGQTYTIEKLSDGERSALLLAAEILTAEKGTVFLLDEPERHLHRSIISPLLSELFAARSDCYFVISTHEVLLPEDCGPAGVLILRGSEFGANGVATRWHVDVVQPNVDLDEDIKVDIWGARRKLLYVEGKPLGVDERLYSALFPETTAKAKGSCEEVIKAVEAARSASGLHWLEVRGLIDGDARSPEEVGDLMGKGIFVLPVRTVESLYYGKETREALASRQAEHLGQSQEELIGKAQEAVLDHSGTFKSLALDEESALSELVAARDVESIVEGYPIGRSAIPNEIARALGYTDKRQYEQAARNLVKKDDMIRSEIAEKCGNISSSLNG